MITEQFTVCKKMEKKQLDNIYNKYGFYNCNLKLRLVSGDAVTLIFEIKRWK